MKFHNIGMVGPFINQKIVSLPVFDPNRDQGRMVWLTDGTIWYGTLDRWVQFGDKIAAIDAPTGLESITESSKTGWRLIGESETYHGDIGEKAVDESISLTTSTTIGAVGDYSHAEGLGTIAQNQSSHSAGMYNIGTSPDTIHETGIGTSDTNRINAFEIYNDGTLTMPVATNINIDNRGGNSIPTVDYVTNAINSIGNATGLEKITEGANSGWRLIGENASNHGNVGNDAVDMTISNIASNTIGATGVYSYATGFGTIAKNPSSYSAGMFNIGNSPNTIHETGIGTSDTSRSNAFEIYMDGTLVAPECKNPNIDVHGIRSLITKEYMMEYIQYNSIPVGFVLIWVLDSIPTGYLECDGSSLLKSNYANLYSVISNTYGSEDNDHFNIPDYRGLFLRGTSRVSDNDPDKNNRLDRGDGVSGNFVGTTQDDELKSHTHNILVDGNATTTTNGLQVSSTVEGYLTDAYSDSIGGNETRPKNINVTYLIKY